MFRLALSARTRKRAKAASCKDPSCAWGFGAWEFRFRVWGLGFKSCSCLGLGSRVGMQGRFRVEFLLIHGLGAFKGLKAFVPGIS